MDSRNIRGGWEIPSEGYCDQPYVVITDDGAWLLSMTTGPGGEGEMGEHVITMRSFDHGQTWSDFSSPEPDPLPESSYSVLLKAPGGRIFCFYNHNTDNMREVKADYPGGTIWRVDSLGHYVFRYSDDGGKTWSPERIEIPLRTLQIDRDNPYGGEVRFFWNVGRPVISNGEVFLTLHRIGSFGQTLDFDRTEGSILHSPDLLTVRNPANATWTTLPDGEAGLRSPEGPIAEEQCLAELSDGSFFCVWRTLAGSPACAYSRDRCHTWTEPDFMRYPDGRRMKHPRAANFVWKLPDGRFLYWFHNHGRKGYFPRNPVWASIGEEYDAPNGRRIRWGDPELLLYDPDPQIGISYPDLVQDGGEYYITQTQKSIARTTKIDPALMDRLLHPAPFSGDLLGGSFAPGPDGFALELDVQTDSGELLRIEGDEGASLALEARGGRVHLLIYDGVCATAAFTDPLDPGKHRIHLSVDSRPGIITFRVDGVLCDGADLPQGWFRLASRLFPGQVRHAAAPIRFRPQPA